MPVPSLLKMKRIKGLKWIPGQCLQSWTCKGQTQCNWSRPWLKKDHPEIQTCFCGVFWTRKEFCKVQRSLKWTNKRPMTQPQACISDSWLMSFWVSLIFSIVSSLFKYSYARISGSEIYKFAFLWYYWWGWSCFNVNIYPFWWNFCQPASVVV